MRGSGTVGRIAAAVAVAAAFAWTAFGGSAAECGKVQLWEGGPYWADRNIGAGGPGEAGLFFWWGDTVGHSPEGSTFRHSFVHSGCPTHGKGAEQLRAEGWITADGVLAPEHDAAHVKWGGGWRMPTRQELSDLNGKCDWIWAAVDGMKGYTVRGRGEFAANSIFLPCAGSCYGNSLYDSGSDGNYWSSAIFPEGGYPWYLCFDYSSHAVSDSGCGDGRNVRPPSLGAKLRVRRRQGRARDGGGRARRLYLRTLEDSRVVYDSYCNADALARVQRRNAVH